MLYTINSNKKSNPLCIISSAKRIEDQLSRLELLTSTIHDDVRDLKLRQNTDRDVVQNLGSSSDSKGLLLIPDMSQKLTWYESWMRCQEMGAEPFIPRTKSDFSVLKTVRFALNEFFWIPASDFAVENHLRWYNGEDASYTPGLEWTEGTHQALNKEERDCVIFGSRHDGVFMWDCNNRYYPMICKKTA
ncbi:unnamed protein product [Meganyctiphanes norvegica]|uniref:C-type lectin domain-containing protein n=1 Tax=Meganyctiphanes norvegica TaxID=48144 RepID=A0AAV2RBM9_MEGNR